MSSESQPSPETADGGLEFKIAFFEVSFWMGYVEGAIRITINLLVSLMMFFIFFLIVAGLMKIARIIMRNPKRPMDPAIQPFVLLSLKLILWLQIIPIVIGQIGIDIDSMLAVISAVALAVGIALKPMVENFIMGMVLTIQKFYVSADIVDIAGVRGKVRKIMALHTVVDQPDGNVIYVPNSKIFSTSIVNYSEAGRARVDVGTFMLSHSVDLTTARSEMLAALKAVELVLASPEPAMIITDISPHGIAVAARVWVEPGKMAPAPFAIRETVLRQFRKGNVTLSAFPTIKEGSGSDSPWAGGGDDDSASTEQILMMASTMNA